MTYTITTTEECHLLLIINPLVTFKVQHEFPLSMSVEQVEQVAKLMTNPPEAK